jgi:hypothetical protein
MEKKKKGLMDSCVCVSTVFRSQRPGGFATLQDSLVLLRTSIPITATSSSLDNCRIRTSTPALNYSKESVGRARSK